MARVASSRQLLTHDLDRENDDQSTVSEGGRTHYHLLAVAQVEGRLHLSAIVHSRGGQPCGEGELTDLNYREHLLKSRPALPN